MIAAPSSVAAARRGALRGLVAAIALTLLCAIMAWLSGVVMTESTTATEGLVFWPSLQAAATGAHSAGLSAVAGQTFGLAIRGVMLGWVLVAILVVGLVSRTTQAAASFTDLAARVGGCAAGFAVTNTLAVVVSATVLRAGPDARIDLQVIPTFTAAFALAAVASLWTSRAPSDWRLPQLVARVVTIGRQAFLVPVVLGALGAAVLALVLLQGLEVRESMIALLLLPMYLGNVMVLGSTTALGAGMEYGFDGVLSPREASVEASLGSLELFRGAGLPGWLVAVTIVLAVAVSAVAVLRLADRRSWPTLVGGLLDTTAWVAATTMVFTTLAGLSPVAFEVVRYPAGSGRSSLDALIQPDLTSVAGPVLGIAVLGALLALGTLRLSGLPTLAAPGTTTRPSTTPPSTTAAAPSAPPRQRWAPPTAPPPTTTSSPTTAPGTVPPASAPTCTHCGQAVAAQAAFCPHCGHRTGGQP